MAEYENVTSYLVAPQLFAFGCEHCNEKTERLTYQHPRSQQVWKEEKNLHILGSQPR